MPQVRKAKPRRTPTTLSELVRDIDDRLEEGDALCNVEVDHEDWTRLVERAEEEAGQLGSAEKFQRDRADDLSALLNRAMAERDALQLQLADAVGWGRLNGSEELLQVVRGLVMALEIERARVPATLGTFTPTTPKGAPVGAPVQMFANHICNLCGRHSDDHTVHRARSRATKKFPKASGPTELCTACGREQGMHDGTRCPEEQHGAVVPGVPLEKREAADAKAKPKKPRRHRVIDVDPQTGLPLA